MNLTNEAAYLYVLSKKLTKVNKYIKKYTKKAHKHKNKHEAAATEEKRQKHYHRHAKVTEELTELMKEHNKLLARLRHHHITFAYRLRKEHKVK